VRGRWDTHDVSSRAIVNDLAGFNGFEPAGIVAGMNCPVPIVGPGSQPHTDFRQQSCARP